MEKLWPWRRWPWHSMSDRPRRRSRLLPQGAHELARASRGRRRFATEARARGFQVPVRRGRGEPRGRRGRGRGDTVGNYSVVGPADLSLVSIDCTQNNFLFYGFSGGSPVALPESMMGSGADQFDGGSEFISAYGYTNYIGAVDESGYSPDKIGNGLDSSWSVVDLTSNTIPNTVSTLTTLGATLTGLAALRRSFAK
jgi:hypothetical protein